MNRKQRVLTVIALIAFAVIGALHYLGWPTITFFRDNSIPYTVWEETTWAEANQKRSFYGHPEHPEIYFQDAIKQQVAIKKHERAVAEKRWRDYLEQRKVRGDPWGSWTNLMPKRSFYSLLRPVFPRPRQMMPRRGFQEGRCGTVNRFGVQHCV